MQVSREELEQLAAKNGQDSHTLSVYLDVDQSRAANLNRGFESALKELLRTVETKLDSDDARREFEQDSGQVLKFISGYVPRGRTLVIFSDTSRNLFWERELQVPLKSDARWNSLPNTKPLIEAIDEYERYCVALVNKHEARLLTVFLGEIEDRREIVAGAKVKQTRSVSKDSRPSADRVQHRFDEQWSKHVKEVAEAAGRLVTERQCGRLIVAGPVKVTSEFQKALPKRLQSMVVASVSLAVESTDEDVLAETLRIGQEVERAGENRIVEDLVTSASKANQAVLGLPDTLEALHEGRIHKLVYREGLALSGAQCTNCMALLAGEVTACLYCGSSVRPVGDLVERMAQLVTDAGGKTEFVRGEPAGRLQKAGEIGAFLRF